MENFQQVKLEGIEYTWTGSSWYRSSDYMLPSHPIAEQLNQKLVGILAEGGFGGTDVCTLVAMARQAAQAFQYRRAEDLARRALTLSPDDAGAAATLACILRASGRPDEALELTDQFKQGCHPDLLTARAAALCDLGRFDEAESLVARVRLMGSCGEAGRLANLIKAARGQLA